MQGSVECQELEKAVMDHGWPWVILVRDTEQEKVVKVLDMDDMELANRNFGATQCAEKLLEIARTGEHHSCFGGAEIEMAAQAILSLHKKLRSLGG